MHDGAPDEAELVALAARVGDLLRPRGITLATAESCTGGLVGHCLTEIAGSSAYYLGGAVSYSDRLKERVLGVPPRLIATFGAVSEEVSLAMAAGARKAYSADVAIAVTGIAGPSGGTATKPVGLTWVAVVDASGGVAQRHVWTGDRTQNKRHSARAALQLLLTRLAEQGHP